jgi:transposase
MALTRASFASKGFDEILYRKYYQQHQQSSIRRKLDFIYAYQSGKEVAACCEQVRVSLKTGYKYLHTYLAGGFAALCAKKIVSFHPSRLSVAQSQAFKEVLLNQRPDEVGLVGNIWTGKLMCEYLQKTYGVVYKKGIYDLLARLGLSHQKAHSDYGNADKSKQIAYIAELKEVILSLDAQSTVLMFDEFSICEKPSSAYAWAEKNTRPTVKTDEKKTPEVMFF